MKTDPSLILGGVVVAIAFMVLVGYVVSQLSGRSSRIIVAVLLALGALFATLPPVLTALAGQ
ncbi:hypothetical protein ACWD8I_14440 [Micromonospora arida]|uniref:hypothetical protein n=1 Tax=Micromonospora arida TaxID=2203715 RepID=UPI0013158657|nr:hypothetical protein [Micromonospora arida]